MAITVGMSCTVETTVCKNNTASAVGSGNVAVFSSPMLIAEMERAASDCIAGELEEGQVSVGTSISISHSAASPIGAKIITTATITAVDRRRVDFSVLAIDNTGEIGTGIHTRFIVDADKFMAKAAARIPMPMRFIHEENRVYHQGETGNILAEVVFPNIDAETVNINRTFVNDSLRGQGVADKLLREAYQNIKSQNKKAVVSCTYAVKWFDKNTENRDILQ